MILAVCLLSLYGIIQQESNAQFYRALLSPALSFYIFSQYYIWYKQNFIFYILYFIFEIYNIWERKKSNWIRLHYSIIGDRWWYWPWHSLDKDNNTGTLITLFLTDISIYLQQSNTGASKESPSLDYIEHWVVVLIGWMLTWYHTIYYWFYTI